MQKKQNKYSLIWFRNDLRIHDNCSVSNALKESNTTIALYCFDKRYFKKNSFGFIKTEKYRAKFLIETITNLKQKLSTLNIPIFVYYNTTEQAIAKLDEEFQFDAIYFQKEWTQEEVTIQNKVLSKLSKKIRVNDTYNQFLYHPKTLNFEISKLPRSFTAFRKKAEHNSTIHQEVESPIAQKPNTINNITIIPNLETLGLCKFTVHPNSAFPLRGGETEALNQLNNYFFETKKLGVYKKTRNGLIGPDFSSKFSPWLANGSISAKTIYWQVKEFEAKHFKNDSTYWLMFELMWRDYFKYISMKYGNKLFKIGGILDKHYNWSSNKTLINQWLNGETKEPFINANMIELQKTGWMSNRGRQNVASYFAKYLKLDWRIGAAYFESLLIDYDVHNNYGNWIYISGVGNDPRNRVFNVKLQADRYDAAGKYQRLWLQDTLF